MERREFEGKNKAQRASVGGDRRESKGEEKENGCREKKLRVGLRLKGKNSNETKSFLGESIRG